LTTLKGDRDGSDDDRRDLDGRVRTLHGERSCARNTKISSASPHCCARTRRPRGKPSPIAIYAYSSSAYEFWAQIKEHQNDAVSAERMRSKTTENSLYFENYGELAVLYFEVARRDGQKLERNKYGNPTYVSLMETDK